MQFLTKKSDSQQAEIPHWHVNFRDFERLPDTKVVRTTFFINTAAIAVAVGMVLWLAYSEYNNRGLREQINAAQRQIDGNSKQNAEALRLSAAFAEEQKKIDEAVAFVKTPIRIVEFVDLLGQTMPKEVLIDTVEARFNDRGSGFQIRGRVAGSPDQASGLASSYVETLKTNAKMAAIFESIALNRIDRDSSGTFLNFDISLNLKGGKK